MPSLALNTMFENAPVINDELFYTSLDRAAADAADQEAFAIVQAGIEQARDNGDLDALAARSMVLGAMACLHDHLQELATEHSHSEALPEDNHHASSPSHDLDKEAKKSKKKLVSNWILSLFGRNRHKLYN